MAVSFPQLALEKQGGEPTVIHSFGEPSESDPPPKLARAKRKQAFGVGTLVTLLSVLALWTTLSACSYVLKRTMARKHESVGRRLAAGEEKEEGGDQQDALAEILRECMDWQARVEGLAGAVHAPEEGQATPQASSSLHPAPLLEELQLGESSWTSASFPAAAGAVPTVWPETFTEHLLGAPEFPFDPFAPEVSSNGASQSLVWGVDSEPSPDVSTTQDSARPGFSTAKRGGKKSTSPSTVLPGTSTAPLPQTGKPLIPHFPPEVPLEVALQFFLGNDYVERVSDAAAAQDSGEPSPSRAMPGDKRSMSPSAFEGPVSPKKQKKYPAQSPGDVQSDAIGAMTSGRLTASDITKQEDAHVTHQPAAYSVAPTAANQAAASHHLGSPISTSSQMSSLALTHLLPQTTPIPTSTLPGVPAVPTSAPGSSDARPLPLPPPATPMPPKTHLYYRLPTLEPGIIPRRFNLARGFQSMSGTSPVPHLQTVRRLLTQSSITPAQTETLITASEEIVSFLSRFHTKPVEYRKSGYAAHLLSRRYLCLEALFCVIQVLGPAMRPEMWWSHLVQSIPTDYSQKVKPRGPRTAAAFRANALAHKLSAALSLLKRGIRPPLRDTVQIKRELFRTELVNLGLRGAEWDEWRRDDDGGEGTSSS